MIDLDEPRLRRAIGDILDAAPGVPSAPLDVRSSPARRRWHLDLAAAAAVVGIGIASVVVVTRDDDRPTTQVAPTTSPASSFEIPANGRLVFDPVPEGLTVTGAGRDGSSPTPDTQVYVENRAQPELGAAVFVNAFEGGALPQRDDGEAVVVQSAPGIISPVGTGERVEFGPVEGVTFALDGYGMTRDELLHVAEGARLGEHGTVLINPALLLPGMTSLTAGSYYEGNRFLPATNGPVDVVGASWLGDDNSRWLAYDVRAEYGNLLAVSRLAHDSVRDVEIGGLDGYVSVNDYPSVQRIVEVTLTDGRRTLFVSASGLAEESYTEDEVIALVATLRPATDEEWAAMLLAGENGAGEIDAPGPPGTEG